MQINNNLFINSYTKIFTNFVNYLNDMINEDLLVCRLSQSDVEAFNIIYKRYYAKLVNFSFSFTKDISISENLAQDTFAKLWENRALLKDNTNLPAYLTTIIRNSTLNFLKRLKIQNSISDSLTKHSHLELDIRCRILESSNPSELFSKEIEILFGELVKALPIQTRRVLILSRYEKKGNKEIALILNISTKGVEFHITKALKVLKRGLKDYLPYLIGFFFYRYIGK